MTDEIYFLSSLDSEIFESTRKCIFLKMIRFDTGKECVLAEIDPPVIGQHFDVGEDIKYVFLSNRHEGGTLSTIQEFPCFVFIARPLADDVCERAIITKDDLQIMAWGELYRSKSDADDHVFD